VPGAEHAKPQKIKNRKIRATPQSVKREWCGMALEETPVGRVPLPVYHSFTKKPPVIFCVTGQIVLYCKKMHFKMHGYDAARGTAAPQKDKAKLQIAAAGQSQGGARSGETI
jgi:hypothetical protein